ncbi:hypothetical protein [Parasphaerochaeta coccoides]|uniref:Lipoprotein n=1 Tax=Parasphaerochaeta coccoides (strain ATCC BAA-1237 / DSM 17374 / SPN1) TaxID=760011 RepID=F4GJU4_PARC1|nr:hypothetical protein [Parasphaerochaeta coccoides]AEC01369.1 hypothetical protein Spico_0129 [Parasphaerochaeta coccoides DSM 17374]
MKKKHALALLSAIFALALILTSCPEPTSWHRPEPVSTRVYTRLKAGDTYTGTVVGDTYEMKIVDADYHCSTYDLSTADLTAAQITLVKNAVLYRGYWDRYLIELTIAKTYQGMYTHPDEGSLPIDKPYVLKYRMEMVTPNQDTSSPILGRVYTKMHPTYDILQPRIYSYDNKALTDQEKEVIRSTQAIVLTSFSGWSYLQRGADSPSYSTLSSFSFTLDPDMPTTDLFYAQTPTFLMAATANGGWKRK